MTATPQDLAARTSASTEPPVSRGWSVAAVVTAVGGVVAIVCAVLLPLLPVSVDRPVISWPQQPGAPQSTDLGLVAQRPVALDVRFTCADVAAAARTADGVVVSTFRPGFPAAEAAGLSAVVRGDRLVVTTRGQTVSDGPASACDVAIHGDLGGLVTTVDGAVVSRLPGTSQPDVDALVSSLSSAPGLQVRLSPDDEFATSPTPLKVVVLVVLVLAVVVALVGLGLLDRERPGSPERVRWRRPAVVDVLVPLVMLAWTFIAPTTDDDGYYSAMAANVPFSGFVGNYYQLYDQAFTPYTWIYYALAGWQGVAGTSPVVLRLPALAFGLATWFLVRAFTRPLLEGRVVGRVLPVVLGAAFLAWWLPYDMGVRPEAVVAASVMASSVALMRAVERDRLLPMGLAVAAAGVGFTAGTTGFVALAPLLVGAPACWRVLRARGRHVALPALVGVVAAGGVVSFLAFADGSLRDFLRAQQIFRGLQYPESWSTEIVRWNYLLSDTAPMGSYAKRLPVLLTLFVLVGFLLLAAGRRGWPPRLRFAGLTTLLGFLLLWMTPSKWTHHFGSLAGIGTVVLAGVLVLGPGLARAHPDRPVRWPVGVGALVGLAFVVALSMNGPNTWAYSWLLGMPHPTEAPAVSFVRFGSPVWWLLGAVVVTVAIGVLARRRGRPLGAGSALTAVPVVATVALLVSLTYLLGSFGYAAVRTLDTYSPGADALRDPLASRCGAEQAVEALDPRTARVLPTAEGAPTADGDAFPGGTWSPSSPPPVTGVPVWGSHRPGPDGVTPADGAGTGTFTTPWYALPTDADALPVSLYVSGRTGDGDEVRAEFRTPTGVVEAPRLGQGQGGKAVDAREWRSVTLDGPASPPPGATEVRLVVVDGDAGTGGWTAVTAPLVQRWTPLADLVPPGSATAVGWPTAFMFPCLRAPRAADGVSEPVATVVTWGDQPLSGVSDSAFLPVRGGLFVPSYRNSAVTQLSARFRDAPPVPIQVYTLRDPLPDDRYTIDPRRVTVPGWQPAPNTTFSVPVGEDGVVRP
ncbi:arabinosyltransferase domain-containing protein [Actinomycetospora chiangmaiensis]|uniref:arabinosyltransferase domain-containing protein n=1 Tax=Actinomycetospora chiangmaiensis TaxID=402650 RepID=UPI00037C8316|nr:arabinosyltransferase domain-containing protein [Actinomycetospora chiangmaiensis]